MWNWLYKNSLNIVSKDLWSWQHETLSLVTAALMPICSLFDLDSWCDIKFTEKGSL